MFVAILVYVALYNLMYTEFYLWKLDVKGAFPIFNFYSHSCLLLGCLVAVGVLCIYTHGMFGWTGCPSVFQVLAMAMMHIINRTSQGVIRLYVDDYMGFGTLPHCHHDQNLCINTTQDVLGSDGIAAEKTVLPTKSTVLLGWKIDILKDRILVSIPPKGINKILYVF